MFPLSTPSGPKSRIDEETSHAAEIWAWTTNVAVDSAAPAATVHTSASQPRRIPTGAVFDMSSSMKAGCRHAPIRNPIAIDPTLGWQAETFRPYYVVWP